MVAHNSMGEKGFDVSNPSRPVTPERACGRCQSTPNADPCGPCPLYAGWLERLGRVDDERARTDYAAWRRAGGWRFRWALGRLHGRWDEERRIRAVLARFPVVRDRYPNYPNW